MQVPKAPNLWWSIATFYALLFLVSAGIGHATSDDGSVLDLVEIGLLMLILGSLGFMAPFILGDWVSWLVVPCVTAGLIFACLKLKGWTRWIIVMSLIVCINAYGLYLAARAGA